MTKPEKLLAERRSPHPKTQRVWGMKKRIAEELNLDPFAVTAEQKKAIEALYNKRFTSRVWR
jgi:hypothetical protein